MKITKPLHINDLQHYRFHSKFEKEIEEILLSLDYYKDYGDFEITCSKIDRFLQEYCNDNQSYNLMLLSTVAHSLAKSLFESVNTTGRSIDSIYIEPILNYVNSWRIRIRNYEKILKDFKSKYSSDDTTEYEGLGKHALSLKNSVEKSKKKLDSFIFGRDIENEVHFCAVTYKGHHVLCIYDYEYGNDHLYEHLAKLADYLCCYQSS